MLPKVVLLPQQRTRSLPWNCCIGLTALIGLSGCAALQVKMGARIYLAKTAVTAMQATMPRGTGIAPNEKSPLVVSFTEPDGKTLTTEGEGHGKVLWKDLKVTASVVDFDGKGHVFLANDPRVSDRRLPHITVTVPSHPDLHADLDIPVRYDRNFRASFQGSHGMNGSNGLDGSNGSDGSMGSFDPEHPVAGGNGGNGANGSDGQNGWPGEDGPPVQLRVALRAEDTTLLQVSVSAKGRESFFLVDPKGGSLTVTSEGGSGGSGGKGGRGGRGGSGGIGSPPGSSGSNGMDGHDGTDGSPGSGGSITVTYDPQAKPFVSAIHLSNPGGRSPIFREEPVAPLW